MFWKFHLDASGLETLLAKQDVTLKEVLDEEDILQECKTQNGKLIDFLTRDEILKELLHLIVDTPEDVEEAVKYKYMNLACEVITLDIYKILDKIANDTEYLDIIWSYIDNSPPLNPLITSFFSKVISMLICRKGQETFEYLKSHDAVNKLIVHIEISAIMELFIKMVTVVESQEIRIEIAKWLDDEQLIGKLIQLLHPSEKEEKHYNSSQLLSELVRIGRDSISQYTESEDDPLLVTLERKDTMEKLLSTIFQSPGELNSDSSVVHGICMLASMLEIRRPALEGMEELITPMDVERIARGVEATLDVLSGRLPDFHNMLIRPHANSPMETTYGTLDPPLGKVRLYVAALIATAVSANTKTINSAIAETGTIGVLLDLFSRYEWNNFLHSHALQCIAAILCSEINCEDDKDYVDPLLKYLFNECNVIQRCLTLWEGNEIAEKAGHHRKGYMGHLTKIINEIINAKERGPNNEVIKTMYNDLAEDTREQWNELVTGSLEETNKKNLCSPVSSFSHGFETDSDGEDYRPINISQYEGTLQQAFENYQVQPMTNEFIETFGYDEESVQHNENEKTPFDEVGNIDFSINANEESENEKLFESICEQKIQPFEDSDDSEEEDIWEEKQLSFASPAKPRQSKNAISSESDSSSDDEKSPKEEDSNSQDALPLTKDQDDKMEIDSEWTANFDNVVMDVQPTTSDWAVIATSTPASQSSSSENFADFSDITKFDISDTTSVSSPMAVDVEALPKTNPGSVYEVKMEEDNPSQSTEKESATPAQGVPTVNETIVPEKSDLSLKSQKPDLKISVPSDASNSTLDEKVEPQRGSNLTTITVKSIRSPTKPSVTTIKIAEKADSASRKATENSTENINSHEKTSPEKLDQPDVQSSDIVINEKLEENKLNIAANVSDSKNASSVLTNGPTSSGEEVHHGDPMT